MSRRRESIIDIFLVLPWWASAIAAAAAYLLLNFAVPEHFDSSPLTLGIGNAAKSAAPYVAGMFLLIGVGSYIRSFFIKKKFESLEGINEVRQLSWRQFESIVGEAFRRRGYSVLENAVDGPDGGIDLVLRKAGEKFYVQCKQWKQVKVGVKPIRELYGVITAGEAAGGFFVASGEYTQEAREFAKKSGIELVDGPMLADMIAEARSPQPFLDPTIRQRADTIHSASALERTCPSCGGSMVRRVAKRGTNAGTEFWGCSAYPKCRGTRAS